MFTSGTNFRPYLNRIKPRGKAGSAGGFRGDPRPQERREKQQSGPGLAGRGGPGLDFTKFGGGLSADSEPPVRGVPRNERRQPEPQTDNRRNQLRQPEPQTGGRRNEFRQPEPQGPRRSRRNETGEKPKVRRRRRKKARQDGRKVTVQPPKAFTGVFKALAQQQQMASEERSGVSRGIVG